MTHDDRKTILVCGGRDFTGKLNYSLLACTLDDIFNDRGWVYGNADNWMPNVKIVSGGARGADQLAFDYAVSRWCEFIEYPANWDEHGKAAGYIRNQLMLDEEDVDLVVACPGGKGTADMIKRARKAGIDVEVLPEILW